MFIRSISTDYMQEVNSAEATSEQMASVMQKIRSALEPSSQIFEVCEDGDHKVLRVTRLGLGPLVTKAGRFWLAEFQIDDEWGQYETLIRGDLDPETLNPIFDPEKEIVIRPDSGCSTGQRFSDLTCDCQEQLHLTMEIMCRYSQGLLVHIPSQDGRGKGIPFKLGTLWLQDALGLNTVESASILAGGGLIDVRTYAGVVAIMKFMGLSSKNKLVLAANNPEKARIFSENGFDLVAHEPVAAAPTEHTLRHFHAKKSLLNHNGLIDNC